MRMYPEPTGEVRMSLSLRFAAGSHKGMIREGNEDSGYAGPRLLAIADGMGGQAAGEVASSEVISTIVAARRRRPRLRHPHLARHRRAAGQRPAAR